MAVAARWPKVIFYDSHTTLFDWAWCWNEAARRILQQYGSDLEPEAFISTWGRIFSGAQRHSAFTRYRPLSDLLAEGLETACSLHGIPGSRDDIGIFLELQAQVKPFPDVEAALLRQQELGVKVVIFSNVEKRFVEKYVEHFNALDPDLIGSSEEAGVHKPNPRAYRWVLHQLGLEPRDALYCAAPSFDVVGAMSTGMVGVLLRRAEGQHRKEVYASPDLAPDFETDTLDELTDLIHALRGR